MKIFIRRHPVISFVIIAYGWTWLLAAQIEKSLIFPLLALFGPCVAALVVILVTDGRAGLADIDRRFRPSASIVPWSLLAGLLPLVLLVPQWLLHNWWWGSVRFEMNPVALLSVAVAVLIVGEEVGWRGYLLPNLLHRYSPVVSSLIVGFLWAVWHLANFLIPNYPHYGLPFSAFVIMTVAFSVLFTWFYVTTNGSLLIAVIFHAALNLFSLGSVEPTRHYWLKAVVYSVTALVIWAVWKQKEPLAHTGSYPA